MLIRGIPDLLAIGADIGSLTMVSHQDFLGTAA
jgi:hypothetical protein